MRLYQQIICLSVILFVLVACDGPAPQTVHSTMTAATLCSPPCWNGIFPGQTSRTEVLEALDLAPNQPEGLVSWPSGILALHINNPMCNQIGFDENLVVEVISVWTDDGPNFEEVVSEYGAPQLIIYGVLNRGEAPWQRIGLLYPEVGLLFATDYIYEWSAARHINIDMPPAPDMRVMETIYFRPQTTVEFEEWFLLNWGRRLIGEGGRVEGNSYTRAWGGWGK